MNEIDVLKNRIETLEGSLDKSLELNRITTDMLKDRTKTQRAPWICCGIVTVCLSLVVAGLLLFFSQYEFYYEEILQDTGSGTGNNVYLPGENAQYNEQNQSDGGGNNVFLPGENAGYNEKGLTDGETND